MGNAQSETLLRDLNKFSFNVLSTLTTENYPTQSWMWLALSCGFQLVPRHCTTGKVIWPIMTSLSLFTNAQWVYSTISIQSAVYQNLLNFFSLHPSILGWFGTWFTLCSIWCLVRGRQCTGIHSFCKIIDNRFAHHESRSISRSLDKMMTSQFSL